MKPIKKIQRRLDARLAAHSAMMKSSQHEAKVQIRIDSGGFARPGSRKKAR
jgi:hypothetical protein